MRKCECGREATHVNGYYLVGPRRVRVWACLLHAEKIGLMPTPADVLAGMKANDDFHAEMERLYRTTLAKPQYQAHFAGTGHGEPIPGDRVAAWRWGA